MGIAKVAVWSIRFFQLAFAIILMGVLSYIIDEYREFSHDGKTPREVITSEVFSVLAIVFTTFGIAAVFFFGYWVQLTAAFLDFCMWVGYLASAGLLRHNYQTDGGQNPLEKSMNAIRRSHGARGHQSLNRHIVGLVSGLVVLQIIFYFCTMIISVFVAQKTRDAAFTRRHTMSERQSRFSFSRNSRASSEKPVGAV